MNWNAKWIKSSVDFGEVCPVFSVKFDCSTKICKAVLSITALGVYEAELNGQPCYTLKICFFITF